MINEKKSMKPEITKGSGTVMVVDDEPVLVDLMLRFLGMAGYQTHGFTSGEEAVAWYQQNSSSVDLIILDMKMPKMDGPACFANFRETNPQAKVVLLSGYIHDEDVQELLQKGAYQFFQKPLRYPEILSWIAETLSQNRCANE